MASLCFIPTRRARSSLTQSGLIRRRIAACTQADGAQARGLFERLAESGLDEIRFSVKIDAETSTNREAPQAESLERQVSRISLAVGVVPSVMVEMPVVPGEQDTLRTVMRRLDDMGAFGINLLEFCFPLHNAASYVTRGFALRSDPSRIPYDYRYAGALPVFGSEQAAYELMEWGIRQGRVWGALLLFGE